MSQRYIMRVELTRQAKRDLAYVADRQGMTQLSMLSRVVRWLSDQPTSVQAAVLGLYVAEGNEDVGRMVLRQLATQATAANGRPAPAQVESTHASQGP
jgi:hypothetical protein